jgi:hypothetical protein
LVALAACGSDSGTAATPTTPITPTGLTFKSNPCGGSGTVQLGTAQTARIDCSGGGTTVTLAGAGASYLIVPQFATDQGANSLVSYTMASGTAVSASVVPNAFRSSRVVSAAGTGSTLPAMRPMAAQLAADRLLLAKGHQLARSSSFRNSALRLQQSRTPSALRSLGVAPPPAVGSVRAFHVASSFTAQTFKTVGATLSFVGDNILLYIDTLAPANGFTPAQLSAFGTYFDKTLYPIDTAAFGAPVDLDQNGRVIVLMSPTVNALSPSAQCATQGFVAGFFDTGDFDGPADPNSNQGEIFYTMVPDPLGTFSCAHTASSLGSDVPATFLHELQHLIYFSQHVIVSGTGEGSSWMDEGMSIVAEELGSLYYEQKCPPPSCRTSPAQLFPDSSQGFIQSFLYDSYQYALVPDTVSVTLHDDSENGFSWRGGAWLMMRWLGDQVGAGIFKKLERGPANGVANIEQATGQSFPALFANFGLALATDSLRGLPRATAPQVNRFTTRNMKALWARLFATSGGASDVPRADPVTLFPITSDTTAAVLSPGTMTFFRLDTPVSASTVTIRFAAPGGAALSTSLHPQLAIFRLPAGL